MKTSNQQAMPFAPQIAVRMRRLILPAGVFAYVFSGLLAASGAAHADDLDIYTKATAMSGGAPVVAMVTDTSAAMAASLLSASGATATTLLHERSYGMKDALRAVVTSGPGDMRLSLTDYAEVPDASNDNGRIVQEMVRVADVASTISSGTTFTSPVDKRIINNGHDATQTATGAVRLNDNPVSIPVRQSVSPYAGIISSAWTSSGGAGLGGTAADGIEDPVVDATKWQNAYSNGNRVYYYNHNSSSTDLTQTFNLDSGDANTNTVLFFIEYYPDTPAVLFKNDDRAYALNCPSGYTAVTSGVNAGKCKNGGSVVDKVATVNKNSTVSVSGLTPGKWYMLVVATRDSGKADTFTLSMADSTKGTFWDSDSFSSGEKQKTGLYFPDIQIPKGASISSAKLQFTRVDGTVTSPVVKIGVDTNVAAPDFSLQNIISRSLDEGSNKILSSTAANPELDITTRVQNQVNRTGWCPGSPMVFVIRDADSSLNDWVAVRALEAGAGTAPRLVITFDPSSGDPAACATERAVTLSIGAMSEDVNQFADGSMDVHKDYMPGSATDATLADKRGKLWLSNSTKVGLRFTLAPVSPGATIVSAKLKLTAKAGAAQPLWVGGILSPQANAQAFFADVHALNAVNVTTEVPWTPTSWVAGTVYESPNLASIVQQQIDQAGWINENTLGFVLRGTTAEVMKACAWENGPSDGFASIDPSQFGSCAAKLELVINDHGAPVQTTNRRVLVEKMMNLKKTGRQPMGGAYLKTARYLAGKFSTFPGDSVPDQGSVDTGSPVQPPLATGDCSSNTIVYISDVNEGARYPAAYENQYSSFASSVGGSISCTVSGGAANQSALGCNKDLAKLLFDGFTPEGATDTATVKTYTFNFNATAGGGGVSDGAVDLTASDSGGGNLRSIAESGGGAFKQSGSSAQLVKQLLTVLRSIADSGASVAAPGISVNALNRFEHLDQLYYSLFKPSTKIDWTGNVKRYQLLNSDVADVNGNVAVDLANNAFFKTDARSFWSSGTDGATVTIGGAAGETDAAERRIFTYLGANSAVQDLVLGDELVNTNDSIDEYKLGINLLPGFQVSGSPIGDQVLIDARRNQIIEFLRATPKYDTTVLWGASIHNSPRIVAFSTADPANPVITVFYGDNRGFLHAIDAGEPTSDLAATNLANTGGKELFSFIPQELLRNAAYFHDNTRSVLTDGYIYGMDGDMRLDYHDNDSNGTVDAVSLYAGLRRGGKNYYALDVSKARRDMPVSERTPTLQWVIEGGTGDYAEMGQTWSALSVNNINLDGEKRRVLVFGGGYDPAMHDKQPAFQNVDQAGRVLYITDPADGALIWKSSNLSTSTFPALASMKYSIVATPRLIDRNADGVADAIYVVDLAGQIFRFELNKLASSASNLISGVVLVAKLGATAAGADGTLDNRRFYDSPSVAHYGSDILLAVSSGYREEPTSKTTAEAFFFIKDRGAFLSAPASSSTITKADLADVTDLSSVPVAEQTKPGWYFYFDQAIGEKGIGSPVIFNTAILFTSYVIESLPGLCVPNIGKTRLYLMGFDAAGLTNVNEGDATASRFRDIGLPGLADTPQIIFREGGGIDVAVGVRVSDGTSLIVSGGRDPFADFFNELRRSRWYIVD